MDVYKATEIAYQNGYNDAVEKDKGRKLLLSFAIPYPTTKGGKAHWCREYGLNAYYAGKHWARRRADAEYWHTLTRAHLPKARMFKVPVIITFCFNDNLDISNHAAIAKMIEDAMKGRIIEDDSRKYVVGHEYYFHDENFIRVTVRETT